MAAGALQGREDLVAVPRHEADAGVEAEGLGATGGRAPALDPAQVEVGEAQPLRLGPPQVGGPLRVGQALCPVDEHQWPAVDLDVAVVGERGGQPPDVGQVVGVAELLGHQHPAGLGVPVAGPLLVGPAQGEGEVRGARGQDLVERSLEQALPVEPVVVVDEAGDPVLGGQIGLGLSDLGDPQIVIAQVGRHVGLVVPGEQGLGLRDVGPLGEARSPPLVVLRNGVELGKVERKRPRHPLTPVDRRPLSCHGPNDTADPGHPRKAVGPG